MSLPLPPTSHWACICCFNLLQAREPSLKSGLLTHCGFTSESAKKWDINFCPKCGTAVYYQLKVGGNSFGIDAGRFDPPTFLFDLAGEVFIKSKAHFIGDIEPDGHFEKFPGYEPKIHEEERLKSGDRLTLRLVVPRFNWPTFDEGQTRHPLGI